MKTLIHILFAVYLHKNELDASTLCNGHQASNERQDLAFGMSTHGMEK